MLPRPPGSISTLPTGCTGETETEVGLLLHTKKSSCSCLCLYLTSALCVALAMCVGGVQFSRYLMDQGCVVVQLCACSNRLCTALDTYGLEFESQFASLFWRVQTHVHSYGSVFTCIARPCAQCRFPCVPCSPCGFEALAMDQLPPTALIAPVLGPGCAGSQAQNTPSSCAPPACSFESLAMEQLPSCPPQHSSRICWALAVLGHKPPVPWLHALLVQLRASMKALNDRCVDLLNLSSDSVPKKGVLDVLEHKTLLLPSHMRCLCSCV